MYSKIILFVAILYIANASVIIPDAYEGVDVQNLVNAEDSPALRACNSQECDQRCRKLKLPGGVCVNGRCKCDYFRRSEDFEALIEEYISWRCNPEKCNKKCQNKKLPGGKCVKRRCKCDKPERVEGSFTAGDLVDDEIEESDLPLLEDNSVNVGELSSDHLDLSERRRCSQRICNFKCTRKGLGAGTCADGKCKCSKQAEASLNAGDIVDDEEYDLPLNELEDNEVDVAELSSDPLDLSKKRRCSQRVCNFKCARKGLGAGTCADGKCKCSKQDAEVGDVELKASDPIDLTDRRRCFQRTCNFMCLRKGLGDGSCVDGKCECSKKEAEVEDAAVFSDLSHRPRCIPRVCNYICVLRGSGSGTCVDGRCKCADKVERLFSPDDINENAVDEADVNEIAEADFVELLSGRRRCLPRICKLKCIWKRFDNGTCVDGECKCANKESDTPATRE